MPCDENNQEQQNNKIQTAQIAKTDAKPAAQVRNRAKQSAIFHVSTGPPPYLPVLVHVALVADQNLVNRHISVLAREKTAVSPPQATGEPEQRRGGVGAEVQESELRSPV